MSGKCGSISLRPKRSFSPISRHNCLIVSPLHPVALHPVALHSMVDPSCCTALHWLSCIALHSVVSPAIALCCTSATIALCCNAAGIWNRLVAAVQGTLIWNWGILECDCSLCRNNIKYVFSFILLFGFPIKGQLLVMNHFDYDDSIAVAFSTHYGLCHADDDDDSIERALVITFCPFVCPDDVKLL